MQVTLVMTIIGPDRPGLVDALARVISEHGGNWLESRMSRLGGQFAGILRIALPGPQEKLLSQALSQMEHSGLTIVVHSDPAPQSSPQPPLVQLELVGQDRPGIIRQISRVLASHGINVEELQTECSSAAMTGETLFKAKALLKLPGSCDLAPLRSELEKIAADLIVEISLEPSPNSPANQA